MKWKQLETRTVTKKIVADLDSIARCCRMSSGERSEACRMRERSRMCKRQHPQACGGAVGFDRSTFHYKSCRTTGCCRQADHQGDLRNTRPVWLPTVYRSVGPPRSWGINAAKSLSHLQELGMQLRHKTPKRRRSMKLRDDRAGEAVGPTMHQCRIPCSSVTCRLNCIDTFPRYVPVLDVQPR
jgi:putative transposase